ncbi:cation transporter [Flavobacteriaceae bacterium]|jgi:mercuric ion binding protein|nr:cation transporter [Flavobacteriaceae bacterium]|tara:strand:- start:124 stop:513 length:390 start_codon:yes stop_codon:yes gene_type:complete
MIKQSQKAIMNKKAIFLLLAISALLIISCSVNDEKGKTKDIKSDVLQIAKMETVSLAISGMTCQIGCAKAIQSKLSKKEGVAAAVVVFTDSIATITFDSNKTSAENLSSFITGIAGGNLYTASEIRLNE